MSAARKLRPEKPIPFVTSMVEATLADLKWQTRRVVKHWALRADGIEEHDDCYPGEFVPWKDGEPQESIFAPYRFNDVLWVRETWANMAYDCNEPMITFKAGTPSTDEPGWALPPGVKWKPGMFLRREHARLFLRVKAVRVERVQDISEADAIAEGATPIEADGALDAESRALIDLDELDPLRPYRNGFAVLWDSLNERRGYGWLVNPWVWVYEFERVR